MPPASPRLRRPAMSLATPRFLILRPGDQAELSRRYTNEDIDRWRQLAGLQAAPRQVPEPLIAALFSYLLGERLPGHGTNYLKQHMHFPQAADVGETLTARVAISRLRPDKHLVNLDTSCHGADDRLICEGQALVLFRC